MTDSHELTYTDGEAHCPVDGCEWWVPEGMEYLYSAHTDDCPEQ